MENTEQKTEGTIAQQVTDDVAREERERIQEIIDGNTKKELAKKLNTLIGLETISEHWAVN